MGLAEFIESNKERIVERWQRNAVERLSLNLEKSQLRDALPDFIDDLVQALRAPTRQWLPVESARNHGRQRMRAGVDMGSLTEEMTLIGETVTQLADEQEERFSSAELLGMMSVIGRGAAVSVRAYAALRDKELADQAAQHFSFIAHELRNPLQNACLAAQVLAAVPESARASHLERLERALQQLTNLVNDSLIEARLYGEPRLNVERVGSRELIEFACDDLAAQMKDRGQQLTIRAEDFSIDVDRTVIVSALTNLLKNAIRFTPDSGHIVIGARQDDDRAVFEVTDQCGGISEDLLPCLFEPFVQARPDTGGTGLGLVIVKKAVEAHGGTVHVNNHFGPGCCFVLDLPRRRQPSK